MKESDGEVEITVLLRGLRTGDLQAQGKLYELLFADLRKIAARHLQSERTGHTLQPTALVHEAWMRLADQWARGWQSRAHFLSVASLIMRRVLVDYARKRNATKREGSAQRVELECDIATVGPMGVEILDLDQALQRLEQLDARQCRVVECRFFGGMTDEETAEALGVSQRTVKRDWNMARAWLFSELCQPDRSGTRSP